MTMDILRMQRRLQDVGVPQEQAEVFVEEIARILASEVATKADLRELENKMDSKFTEIENKLIELRVEVAGETNNIYKELYSIRNAIAELRNEMADLKVAVASYQANTAKWAVGMIGAVLLGFTGMTVAVILAMVQLSG